MMFILRMLEKGYTYSVLQLAEKLFSALRRKGAKEKLRYVDIISVREEEGVEILRS